MELIQQRNQPTRKRIRLEEYDYSEHGAYFVTLCTNDRKQLFWDVGADIIRPYDFNGCGINETMGVKTGRKTDLAKVLCGSCDLR